MKNWILGVVTVGALVLAGCENKSQEGGPGATNKPRDSKGNPTTSSVKQTEDTFKLTAPSTDTNIKQGEATTVKIGISRGKNFDQDVKLTMSDPPKGVKFDPAEPTIKAGDKEGQVKIEADKDAALGEHEITVTGTPKTGDKATVHFKINIKKP